MNTTSIFKVQNRKITADKKSIDLIGDNTDYIALFEFDADMDSDRVKNARFILNGNKEDRVLDTDNSCQIPPEVLKDGYLSVGVYTADKATTPVYIQVNGSIKDKEYPDKEADPDVYRQLLEKIETLKGVREIEVQNDGEEIQWRYIGEEKWRNLIDVADITGYTPVKGKDYFDGKDGLVIPTTGMYTLDIVGNDLMIYYNDVDQVPDLYIDKSGCLIFGEKEVEQ